MFKHLREQLQGEKELEMMATAVSESLNDNIKDLFLSDPHYVTLGASEDPAIEKLVQSIPEYLPNPDKAIEKITESLIAEIPMEV